MENTTRPMITTKPMIVRRDRGYAVLGIPDLDTLSAGQKVGIALGLWDEAKTLMEVNDDPTDSPQFVDRMLAQALGIGYTQIMKSRYAMNANGAEFLPDLLAGTLDVTNFWRKSGLRVAYKAPQKSPLMASDGNLYYGKGDHFQDATEPLLRYMRAWKKRGFEFRHLNPAEAKRRLKKLNELTEHLEEAKQDLEGRSRVARLSMPRR